MRKRDIGSLWRQLTHAVLLPGCTLLAALFAGPSIPASAQRADDLWQTYISAAASANDRNDYVTSEALLRAALDVALATDPDGLRPQLTALLLQIAYADLNQIEEVHKLGAIRFDLAKADQGLLSLTRQYDRLAMTFYSRWSRLPDSPATEQDRTAKDLTLEFAVRCLRVEVALEKRLLPQSHLTFEQTQRLAGAEALLGEVLRKQWHLDESVEALEEANELRELFRTESETMHAASQQASVLQRKASPQGLDDVVETKFQLGLSYVSKGQDLQGASKPAEAKAAFANAEKMFRGAADYIEPEWPNHFLTGGAYFYLGQLYTLWDTRSADAEPAIRRAIAIHQEIEGLRGANVRLAVETLAGFLRRTGQEDRARQLEAQYDFKN
jgi:tetratricopeptide (TPR) repeat protein